MARAWFKSLVAWLLLIGFGLSHTLCVWGLVVCRDGHGGVSIEVGCGKNATGECVTSCGGEVAEDPEEEHPCDDTPIQLDGSVGKVPGRVTIDLDIPREAASVPPGHRAEVLVSVPARRAWSRAMRPPDVLEHVRTVVLRV